MSVYVYSSAGNNTRRQVKERASHRAILALWSVVRFALIVAITAAFFRCGLSLAGFILIERARHAAAEADMRAAAAEAATADLRGRLDDLTSAAAIEKWATVNGFVPLYTKTTETVATGVDPRGTSLPLASKISQRNETENKIKPEHQRTSAVAKKKASIVMTDRSGGNGKQQPLASAKAGDVLLNVESSPASPR